MTQRVYMVHYLFFGVVKIDKACRIYLLYIYSIKFKKLHYNY